MGPVTGFMLTLDFPLYAFFYRPRLRADNALRDTLFNLARYLTMKKPLGRGLCSELFVVQDLLFCTSQGRFSRRQYPVFSLHLGYGSYQGVELVHDGAHNHVSARVFTGCFQSVRNP